MGIKRVCVGGLALLLALAPLAALSQQPAAPRTPPLRPTTAAPAPAATPAPAPGTPQATPPLRAYKDADLAAAATAFEKRVTKEGTTDTRPIPDIRKDADDAQKRGDLKAAAGFWRSIALRSGPDSAPWWRYAVMAGAAKIDKYDERTAYRANAKAAAYLAYMRANNRVEESLALVQIGRLFAAEDQSRAALTAMKAALDSRETPEIKQAYQELREKKGFRILSTKVDSDAVSPRACVVFSESLRKGSFDYAPFVKQEGVARPAISVEDEQICFDGLKHGETYAFSVREGLPAVGEIGESLLRSADLTVFVRDRTPFVRNGGRNYVLPRTGQKGIPITSVNVDKIDIEVLRIGDRALALSLANDFPLAPESYQFESMKEDKAVPVWSGQMDVARKLNEDVVTAFPVSEAIKDLQPGAYLLSAKPANLIRRSDGEGDDYTSASVQWFIVSDLGLSAYSGETGLTAFAHSLASARPAEGVELRLIARNNDVLAVKASDAEGAVRFEPGLTRGTGPLEPALLVAQGKDGDYAFLNLRQPAFDLSDRGVAGRDAPGPLDAFVTPERGIYRSGETVQLTAILRNARGLAAPNVPLTLIVTRPDGNEYRRIPSPDQGLGGRVAAIPLVSSAPTGTWQAKVYADVKRPPLGQASFLVEDFVPDRIEFTLNTALGSLAPSGQPFTATIDGRYLFGVPAANLELTGTVQVDEADDLPGFKGFVFGEADKTFTPVQEPLSDGLTTDAQGKATLSAALPPLEGDVVRPLKATLTVQMSEPGGRAVERDVTVPLLPASPMIGVKPGFADDRLEDNGLARFEAVMVGTDGKAQPKKNVKWTLYKVETTYQWYRSSGRWTTETVKRTKKLADGRFDLDGPASARFEARAESGPHRLEVTTDEPNGPLTTYEFNAGWGGEGTDEAPDVLELTLDKKDYTDGEAMKLTLAPRFSGVATLAIVSDGVVLTKTFDVPKEGTSLSVPVKGEWGTQAYAVVSLRRPLDAAASRQPGRAIGLVPFAIGKAEKTLSVTLGAPEKTRPRGPLTVPFTINGLKPGEEARLTLAAVDVGILNLTNFAPPRPDEHILGQRKLAAELRDLYGQLIDGMLGTVGPIRSGGDGMATKLMASPPAQDPVSLFSGLVTVGPDGKGQVTFDLPDFNGSLRLMAMTWSRERIGAGTQDVIVRDPIVVTATLPRFLATGDRANARLDLINAEAPAGDVSVTVTPAGEGGLTVQNAQATLRLADKGRASIAVPISSTGAGIAEMLVALKGPGGLDLTSRYRLGLRAPFLPVENRETVTLQPGESRSFNASSLSAYVPGTGRVVVSGGVSSALDVPALLSSLDLYPYGCSEQTISRALPMLYLSDLGGDSARFGLTEGPEPRLRSAIDRVVARQSSNGGVGLWNSESEDLWITAYAVDFLTRARDKGFAVPQTALTMALDRLKNAIAETSDGVGEDASSIAYAHYLLARNGRGVLSDLRFLAESKLTELTTPMARAQIGAALALMGDQPRAARLFASALNLLKEQQKATEAGRSDYGSRLRDAAALVALASDTRQPRGTVDLALQLTEFERGRLKALSTQEQLWLVLAARAVQERANAIRVEASGETLSGAFSGRYDLARLQRGLTLTNRGGEPLALAITSFGAPLAAPPAVEQGMSLTRRYFTLDGKPADPARVAQGTRLVVVLQGTDKEQRGSPSVIVDPLPAGFEIENPRLIKSAENKNYPWLQAEGDDAVSAEFRDDRFIAYYSGSDAMIALYTVRAVSPGSYAHPGAELTDMYRPERIARTKAGRVEVSAP